jgi:type II secretory pathway component PulJ
MNRSSGLISPLTPAGFTLIEVLVSTALTLLLMASIASLFAFVTNSVSDSRALVEMTDRLRTVKQRLQLDLEGITAPTTPPLNPDQELGYFEYIEGPIGPLYTLSDLNHSTIETYNAANPTAGGDSAHDETLADNDDVLMFTTRSLDSLHTGRCSWAGFTGGVANSPLAEVCWFLRGNSLYRRKLLIIPNREADDSTSPNNMYQDGYFNIDAEVSMRMVGGNLENDGKMVAGTNPPASTQSRRIVVTNSLGDLTKRENRYCHQPLVYPHDARFWGRTSGAHIEPGVMLPTARESSCPFWPWPYYEYDRAHKLSKFGSGGPPYVRPWAEVPPPTTSTTTFFYPNWRYVSPSFVSGQGAGAFLPWSSPGSYNTPSSNVVNAGLTTTAAAPNIALGFMNLAGLWGAPSTTSLNNIGLDPWGGVTRDGTIRQPYVVGFNTSGQTVDAGRQTAFNIGFTYPTSTQVPNLSIPTGAPTSSSGYDGSISDDLVMTNVISFDVRAWDPGAPIFQTQAYDWQGNALNPVQYISIAPGDPGYSKIINYLVTHSGTLPPGVTYSSFGAYVDLNAMASATSTTASGVIPAGTGQARYIAALQNSSTGSALLSSSGTLPKPVFCDGGQGLLQGQNSPVYRLANGSLNYGLIPNAPIASVYDTFSTHYESDGLDQPNGANAPASLNFPNLGFPSGDGVVDSMTNGVDDNNANGIDDATEYETIAPYPYPLRSIQIRIRTFEPDSRQMREVTLTHEFLPE